MRDGFSLIPAGLAPDKGRQIGSLIRVA